MTVSPSRDNILGASRLHQGLLKHRFWRTSPAHWHTHLALPLMPVAVVILAATFSLRLSDAAVQPLLVSGICTGFLLFLRTWVMRLASGRAPRDHGSLEPGLDHVVSRHCSSSSGGRLVEFTRPAECHDRFSSTAVSPVDGRRADWIARSLEHAGCIQSRPTANEQPVSSSRRAMSSFRMGTYDAGRCRSIIGVRIPSPPRETSVWSNYRRSDFRGPGRTVGRPAKRNY